ncbi:MAG: UvrD-helicase domain-containing protein [Candidatus Gracilibacteria bacterium]
MSRLLEGLNEMQKDAVLTTEGPLLIIAGAGSGKTKALTHRIAYLMEEKGVTADRILAVTFTNKAANEMKERVTQLCPYTPHSTITMGTFHSICVRILRREIHHLGFENSFTIYDSADTIALMKNIFKERHIDDKQFNPKAVLGGISNAKNELITPEKFSRYAASGFHELVAELYPIYQRELRSAQALDFDDLIMKTVELFMTFPDILAKYQEKFQYISVDEYQDTNNAQYRLIKMLADKYKNLCVIGDDWQSIYSWRGANMQNILTFEKDYPNAKTIKLEQNYRSTQVIVKAANAVIKCNQERTDKELWTEKESEEKIHIFEARDERHEVEKIIQMIQEKIRNGHRSYSEFAFLYRTNAQSRVLEEGMMRHGMPYKIIGGVKFYERKEVKDILAYARLTLNPQDNISLLRVINVPARKIGLKTIQTLQVKASELRISLFDLIQRVEEFTELTPAARGALMSFRELIKSLREANQEFSASGVMKHILKLSGYERFILDGTLEGEERFQNVEELISVASKYDALESGISLATFLEEAALVSDIDTLDDQDNAVTLMTLHASKGLEFPHVYIVGMEEGIFPSSRSQLDPKALEEERRLMYVGMTRAKDKLTLSYAKSRMLYGEYQYFPSSRFIEEIPEEFVEYDGVSKKAKRMIDSAFIDEPSYSSDFEDETYEIATYNPGDLIRHASWGIGKVLEVQGDLLTVAFQNPLYGRKKLAANIAPIEKIG